MDTKHTPGPWKPEQQDARLCVRGCESLHMVYVERSNPSHNVGGTVKHVIAENCEPEDARLIAAAPDLLSALDYIVNDAKPGEDARLTVNGYNRACAAIAKARGEG